MKSSPKSKATNPAPAAKPMPTSDAEPRARSRSNRSVRKGTKPRDASPYAETLLETFASNARFEAFSEAIGTAGLAVLFGGVGPITIFAPTNNAFAKLSTADRAALLGDPARLADLVRRHVVSRRVKAPRIGNPNKVTPEYGKDLELTATDGGFHVDAARIVKTNIRASNGVIHAIDSVLDLSSTA